MNITDIPLKNKPPTTGGRKDNRSADYRQWRDDVAALLQEKGFYDEAERWDYCDNSPRYKINRTQPELPPSAETVWVCSKSSRHDAVLFSASCDNRCCPDCAHRHTARLLNRYLPAIEEQMDLHPEYRLRTLTLTRSVELGCADFGKIASNGFALIQKAMTEVVGPHWNKDGAGLLANWEVGPNGHKLHYHCVYLGKWVSQKMLSKSWERLTGGDKVVWVMQVDRYMKDWRGAVVEALKYATKFYSENWATGERIYLSPELTVELMGALRSTRRIRSYGSFYRLDEETERLFCCQDCGSRMARITIGHYELWRLTGFCEDGWRTAIRKSVLQFRIADNYPPITANKDNSHPKSTRLLPGFDKSLVQKTTHYDYE